MWKFRPGTEREAQAFLEGLRGLYGVIPQIKAQEVGQNCVAGNYDAVLISTFDTEKDLAAYQADPRHVAVSGLCKEIRESRVAVDFEVPVA